MTSYRLGWAVGIAAAIGIAVCACDLAVAQTEGALAEIADNDSIFIDGVTFKILPGRAKGDAAKKIEELGARELGPGALVFRSGNKLYIVDVAQQNAATQQAAPAQQTAPAQQAGPAQQSEPAEPDEQPRTNRIRIEYVPPKNPAHQKVYDLVKEHRALEKLQQIFAPFRFPLDVTIKTVGCDGVSNAWYDRQGKKPIISLCYEYLQEIYDKMAKGTTPAGFSPTDTLVGPFFYAATHELGHASFDLLDVPVFGREEDAADQFAAYIMLQFGKERARALIGGTAYSYSGWIKGYKNKPNVSIPLLAFSSNHGSPEERFYNLVCIAYGSDATLFADVVEKEYLPQSRAKGCRYEYQVLAWAFHHTISPQIDQAMARKVLDTEWLPKPEARPTPPK
jgi:hypothetical protein